MGICWSEPPIQPAKQVPVTPYIQCRGCGIWNSQDYCEACLQRNAMKQVYPNYTYAQAQQLSQPQLSQPQYTYAVPYPPPQSQQQMYSYYQARPQYPQQQQQMGTGTALAAGFVVGALVDDMFDSN